MPASPLSSLAAQHGIIWLMLLLLTAGIYGRSTHFGFLQYDDNSMFTDREVPNHVTRRMWTTPVIGNWQPIVTLTFVADRRLHGLNPHWLHVEETLLHALCAIAVFELLRLATGRQTLSGWAAVLFVCTPMHVESVAWLSERKDEMAALFFFLSLIAYTAFTKRHRISTYVVSLCFAALSLMCKPMAVTLPGVLLLLDFWPLQRTPIGASMAPSTWTRLLLEKLPFVILALASAAIATVTQTALAMQSGAPQGGLSLTVRLDNAIVCYVLYVWKLILPLNLAVYYPHPGARPVVQVLAALALLLAVSALAIWQARRRPYLLIGWLWFVGTLVPVIGVFQIGGQAMADRYSYIPSVGLFIMLAWGLNELVGSRPIAAAGATFGGIITVAAYSILAFVQVGYWIDTETVFAHAIDVTGNNWAADIALGDAAFARNDRATAAGYFSEVIRLAPGNPKGYARLAECVIDTDPRRAARLLRSAIQRAPRAAVYRLRLAWALTESNDIDTALIEARRALMLDPENAQSKAAVDDLSRRGGR